MTMFKWIRWAGLIPFALIIGGISLFFLLFSNNLIQRSLETNGTQANQAKVDVASVRLTLQPIGFVIENMQITDKNNPMRNLIEFERAAVQIDLVEALLGKLIIEEISFIGVRYDTPRRRSGFIPGLTDRPVVVDTGPSMVPVLGTEMPTLEEIFAREQRLLVLQRADELQATWEQQQQILTERFAALPNQQDLAAYDARAQRLQQSSLDNLEDVRTLATELDGFRTEVARDLEQFARTRLAINQAQSEVAQAVQALQNAPKEDWQRIIEQYSLDQQGLRNALAVVLGPEADRKIQEWLTRYQQAEPVLAWLAERSGSDEPKRQRMEGRFIHFPTLDPLPSFLLKQASLDFDFPAGRFVAQLTELTSDQRVRGVPTRFRVAALDAPDFSDFDIQAEFDRRQGRQDSIRWALEGWALADRSLMNRADLAVQLKESQMTLDGQWQHDGRGWQLGTTADLQRSRLEAQASGLWQSLVAETLEQVRDIDLQLRMGGGAYAGFELDSNLDDQLNRAARAKMDAELARLEAQVMAELEQIRSQFDAELANQQQRLQAYQQDFEQQLAEFQARVESQLQAVEQRLTSRRDQLTGAAQQLLREQQQALDQARKEAQEEADRLRLQAETEAEQARRAAEEAARREAEQRAQELLPSDLPRLRLPGR